MHRPPALPSALLFGALLFAPAPLTAQTERTTPSTSFGTLTVQEGMTRLKVLAEQPAPPGLSEGDAAGWKSESAWIQSVIARMDAVVHPRDPQSGQASGREGAAAPRDVATGPASGKRQYSPVIFRKEFDALRTAIEAESRKFATVSNVLKTRHDTAMSIIRNIKA